MRWYHYAIQACWICQLICPCLCYITDVASTAQSSVQILDSFLLCTNGWIKRQGSTMKGTTTLAHLLLDPGLFLLVALLVGFMLETRRNLLLCLSFDPGGCVMCYRAHETKNLKQIYYATLSESIQILLKRESILIRASSHTNILLDQAISQEYAGLCFNAQCPCNENFMIQQISGHVLTFLRTKHFTHNITADLHA